jgi:hypothetical protein
MISITFHTETVPSFCSTEEFDKVLISELEILLQQCRASAASLEAELMKRRDGRMSDTPGDLGRFCKLLHSTARKLDVVQRLEQNAADDVDIATETLRKAASDASTKHYQTFLYNVLDQCSPGMVLLCAVGLGMKKVIRLKGTDRVELLAYMKRTRASLDLPVLRRLAEECGVPAIDST